jgi:hypothetical protein
MFKCLLLRHSIRLHWLHPTAKIGDVLANTTRTHKLALSESMLDRRLSYDNPWLGTWQRGLIILPTYSRPPEVLLKAARVVQNIQFIHSLLIIARTFKLQDLDSVIC